MEKMNMQTSKTRTLLSATLLMALGACGPGPMPVDPKCAADEEVGPSGTCREKCEPGETRGTDGKCEKDDEPVDCKPNEERLPNGVCAVKCKTGETRGSNGECKGTEPPPKADLEVEDFSVNTATNRAGDFLVCMDEDGGEAVLRNNGRKDAGAYKMAFGIFGGPNNETFGCAVDVPGTRAGSSTTISNIGCCPIPMAKIKSGNYRVFVAADSSQVIDESDEENNIATSAPAPLPVRAPLLGVRKGAGERLDAAPADVLGGSADLVTK
jgi:hypothetical protein